MNQIELAESRLKFTFTDWEFVFKFDEHKKFEKLKGHSIKGCDFTGKYKNNSLFLIEVKDYRDRLEQLSVTQKLANNGDSLIADIVEKVKGVILTTMSRQYPELHDKNFSEVSRILADQNVGLVILLWVEFYRVSEENSNIFISRNKVELGNLKRTLQTKLIWLTHNIDVTNGLIGGETFGIKVEYLE